GWRPFVFSLFFRCVLEQRLGKIAGRLSFLFSSGLCWTGYEGRLEAACLVSFLQVCVGPAMREDCRLLVLSLFFRFALDQIEPSMREVWRPHLFSIILRL
ncbi:hypothetical protein AB205_0076660, partial [Aquarana catesbeiana]